MSTTWLPTPMIRDEVRSATDVEEVIVALNRGVDVRDSDGDVVVSVKGSGSDQAEISYVRSTSPVRLNKDGTRNRRQGSAYTVDVDRILLPRNFDVGPTEVEEQKALASIMKAVQGANIAQKAVNALTGVSNVVRINLDTIEKELHQERGNQRAQGHDWDIADVMDVLRKHRA